jgi:hypothetical protein
VKQIVLAVLAVLLATNVAQAQVGALVWEENFDDLDNWIKLTGNGSWGWGNGELQFYKGENVEIAAVPGSRGTMPCASRQNRRAAPGSWISGEIPSNTHLGE